MKKGIIFLVLTVLLMGLVLSGCSSGTNLPKDVSSGEVIGFLRLDMTEQEKYSSHATYTHQFLKNAREHGIQGYPVSVLLSANRILLFAGFKTTDRGWMYVLPVIDQEVKLAKGKSYRELNGSSPFGPEEDIIVDIMIFQ